MKRFFRVVARTILSVGSVVLAGCGAHLPNVLASSRPVSVGVLCDTSQGASCTPQALAIVLDAVTPLVASRRGTLRLYRLDDIQGAVPIVKFSVGPPPRESRAAKNAHEKRSIEQARALFAQATPGVFANPPRWSPLALGISAISLSLPEPGHDVILYVVTDGRESQITDAECGHLPTAERWHALLDQRGLFAPGSMKGYRVLFVGMNPLAPVDRNRCLPTLNYGLATRELWKSAFTRADATIDFTSESEPPTGFPFGAMLVFFRPSRGIGRWFGGIVWWWKKLRTKWQAKRDALANVFAPGLVIDKILGLRPEYDPNNPRDTERTRQMTKLRGVIDDVSGALLDVKQELTQYPWWGWLAIALGFVSTAEILGSTLILRDAGAPVPERYVLGTMLALFLVVIAVIARQSAKKHKGKLPKWWYGFLAGIGTLCVALTVVRVAAADNGDTEPFTEVMFGVIMLAATIGPAICAEYLVEKLGPILPLVRRQRLLKKELLLATRQFEVCVAGGGNQAELTKAWDNAAKQLRAAYVHEWQIHNQSGVPDEHADPGTVPVDRLNGATTWNSHVS